MTDKLQEVITKHYDKAKGKTLVALYGLGTETERFITNYVTQSRQTFNDFRQSDSSHSLNSADSLNLSIIGLLDGFRDSGELFGYPIIPISTLASQEVSLIIVIARPGSCKAIAKRIGDFCIENNIALYDVRGRDLLASTSISYEFSGISGASKQELMEAINASDVISFDLFDTLVMRKTVSYTDVFELLDLKLRSYGICIPDFANLRLYVEKEMSKNTAPKLEAIYERVLELVGGSFITASELARHEYELDSSLMTVRRDIRDVFKTAVKLNKKVIVTTDSYYSREQIESILAAFDLIAFDNLFISSEYGTAKAQELYEENKKAYPGNHILHIGDDEYADVEKAKDHGIKSFRIYSSADLLDLLGGLGLDEAQTITDRVKIGMFLSRIFNSPFWFEKEHQRLSVKDAYDIGYIFCAPMITDFIHWMNEKTVVQGYDRILFGSRDGYLVERLYRMVENEQQSFYFLTSRTAAIRAGMETESDIDYVDSMKFFGNPEEELRVRFGIEVEDASSADRISLILDKSRQQRENYKLYIEKLGVSKKDVRKTQKPPKMKNGTNLAFFDFVAKGTTQMYLSKLFDQHIKGFYFLQMEPEFMADKGLDIESFYTDQEKDTSAIFDNYYILETILTSPYPQMLEMDMDGNPVFAEESRSKADIEVIKRVQDGIIEFFRDYITIVPTDDRAVNKKLDEKLLELVNKIRILDEEFLGIKVEDPFFGRMTDIKDVIG